MRMSWRVAWLAWGVGVLGAGESRAAAAPEGPPGGGLPAEGVEFLVVNPAQGLCLSLSRGRFSEVAVGRPCEWEAPGAEQRWRAHAGQLVNVATGSCLLAASLGPCEDAAPGEAASRVTYDVLAQRLVWEAPRGDLGCFVLGPPEGLPGQPLSLTLAPLDARECGAEHAASKWMLVPLRP